ncbi:RteC domain-containing protein [Sphingobacterium composti Ten et al. 2007 non Yoo et al. 2007]|uniref:RteC domain-containing protein n=1 Tax=Sphingobacterium composti TaxID=363260 RepID=UPI00135A22DC|nr:RteC domain-containing protein [Sphingobacterium composti Ten et al. 2007 non Yoo et al. 2007]
MNKFYNETLHKLETAINELEIETDCSIQRIEAVIHLILECLSKLKEYVLKRGFRNTDEEIRFFKYQKPAFVAKLIYYNAIYKIETKKPYGAKPIRKYLNKELKKLKRFFNNNLDFYKYYRSNNSLLDDRMFLRGKHDIKLWLDTYYFQSDQSFSTSHDYKVAKIIANDLIQVYIEDQLYNKFQKDKSKIQKKLKWTGSKVALIELIYALHYQNVFDNGNNDIREVALYFESTFDVDLGNFYQAYLELRNRKMNRTKFLDALREELMRRMDELELLPLSGDRFKK